MGSVTEILSFIRQELAFIRPAIWFDIGCFPKKLVSCKRNMPSAYAHSEIVDNYLKEELGFGSIAGPFKSPPFPNLHINRFGVIPKSTPGKWRLITDLS